MGQLQETRGLPALAHTGQMQALFAGVIHQVAQIEQQRLAQILDSFFTQPVLQRKERMTGKAQRRVVQTERFKNRSMPAFFLPL